MGGGGGGFYSNVDGNSNKNVKNDRFNKQNNNFAGADYIVSLPSFPQVLARPLSWCSAGRR